MPQVAKWESRWASRFHSRWSDGTSDAARLSAIQRTVQQLKAAGRRGVLPPPQDISRGHFWRDRARTQPYTEADKERTVEFVDDLTGNPVGWRLGPNLAVNGTFDNGTQSWSSFSAAISVVGGELQVLGAAAGARGEQNIPTVVGRRYRAFAQLRTGTAASAVFTARDGSGAFNILSEASTTSTTLRLVDLEFRATTSTTILQVRGPSGGQTVFADNITIQEVILDESWLGPDVKSSGAVGIIGSATDATYNTTTGAGTASRVDVSNQSFVAWTGLTAGAVYRIRISNTSANTIWIRSGGSASAFAAQLASGFSGEVYVPTGGAGDITITAATSGTSVSFTVSSFQALPGHPIVSAVAGSGLVLSRRVNIASQTENPNAAVWSAVVSKEIGATNLAGPFGRNTAFELTDTNTANFCGIRQTYTIPANLETYRIRLWVRRTSGGTSPTFGINFVLTGGTSQTFTVRVNTDTGSVLLGSAQIVQVGDFWRVTVSPQNNGANTALQVSLYAATSVHGLSNDSASATGTAVVGGIDVRSAVWDAFNLPDYQRVNDGTAGVLDYDDSTAFPLHWRNVTGTQAMMTLGTVDMSAGDARAIIAGCVKLTDSTQGVLAEFGTTPLTVAGTITAATANLATGAGTGYSVRAKGSSPSDAVSTGQPSPHVASLIAEGDISTDLCRLTVNGLQVATSTADQGTGNLGNHRFNIAGRDVGGAASLRFNGILLHLPTLVAADAGVDLQALAREYAASAGFIY